MVQPSPSAWQIFLSVLSYIATPIFLIVAAVALIFVTVALVRFLNASAADANSRRIARDVALEAGLFVDTPSNSGDDDFLANPIAQEGRVVTTGRVSEPDFGEAEVEIVATPEDPAAPAQK